LVILKAYGVKKGSLVIERRIRALSREIAVRINEKTRSKIQDLLVSVTMTSFNRADVEVTVYLLSTSAPKGLAKGIGRSIEREIGIPLRVSARVIPIQYYVSSQVEGEEHNEGAALASSSKTSSNLKEEARNVVVDDRRRTMKVVDLLSL
jgi:hypothetical protein